MSRFAEENHPIYEYLEGAQSTGTRPGELNPHALQIEGHGLKRGLEAGHSAGGLEEIVKKIAAKFEGAKNGASLTLTQGEAGTLQLLGPDSRELAEFLVGPVQAEKLRAILRREFSQGKSIHTKEPYSL